MCLQKEILHYYRLSRKVWGRTHNRKRKPKKKTPSGQAGPAQKRLTGSAATQSCFCCSLVGGHPSLLPPHHKKGGGLPPPCFWLPLVGGSLPPFFVLFPFEREVSPPSFFWAPIVKGGLSPLTRKQKGKPKKGDHTFALLP